VKLDPVQEAKLDEHALLRKASDQQNAQWRVNEARLRFLGIKKARSRSTCAQWLLLLRFPLLTGGARVGAQPPTCRSS